MWDETILIVTDLFENVWGSQHQITVDHVVDITLPVSPYMWTPDCLPAQPFYRPNTACAVRDRSGRLRQTDGLERRRAHPSCPQDDVQGRKRKNNFITCVSPGPSLTPHTTRTRCESWPRNASRGSLFRIGCLLSGRRKPCARRALRSTSWRCVLYFS